MGTCLHKDNVDVIEFLYLKSESNPHLENFRTENQKLKNELKELTERLQRAQVDLESEKRRSYQQEQAAHQSPRKKLVDNDNDDPTRVITHLVKSVNDAPVRDKQQHDSSDAIRVA